MTKEYIEREALKQDLKESYDRLREIYYGLTYDEDKQICAGQLTTFTDAILRVKEAPTADVAEVRHGRWMDNEDYMFCSCCGMQWNYCDNDTQDFHYCPNCGSRMDGEGE